VGGGISSESARASVEVAFEDLHVRGDRLEALHPPLGPHEAVGEHRHETRMRTHVPEDPALVQVLDERVLDGALAQPEHVAGRPAAGEDEPASRSAQDAMHVLLDEVARAVVVTTAGRAVHQPASELA
jgi:hypothetical protein